MSEPVVSWLEAQLMQVTIALQQQQPSEKRTGPSAESAVEVEVAEAETVKSEERSSSPTPPPL